MIYWAIEDKDGKLINYRRRLGYDPYITKGDVINEDEGGTSLFTTEEFAQRLCRSVERPVKVKVEKVKEEAQC